MKRHLKTIPYTLPLILFPHLATATDLSVFSSLVPDSVGWPILANALNKDDKMAWINGHGAFFSYDTPHDTYTPEQIFETYQSGNELKANATFNKPFRVKLKVSGVAVDGFGKNHVFTNLDAYGIKSVSFDDISNQTAETFTKGQSIDLICKRALLVLNRPFAKDCELTTEYLRNIPGGFKQKITIDEYGKPYGYILYTVIRRYFVLRDMTGASDKLANMSEKQIMDAFDATGNFKSKKVVELWKKYTLSKSQSNALNEIINHYVVEWFDKTEEYSKLAENEWTLSEIENTPYFQSLDDDLKKSLIIGYNKNKVDLQSQGRYFVNPNVYNDYVNQLAEEFRLPSTNYDIYDHSNKKIKKQLKSPIDGESSVVFVHNSGIPPSLIMALFNNNKIGYYYSVFNHDGSKVLSEGERKWTEPNEEQLKLFAKAKLEKQKITD